MLAIINVLSEVLGSLSSKFETTEEQEKKELLKKSLEQLEKRKRENRRPILLQEESIMLCLKILEGRGIPQETILALVNNYSENDVALIAQKIMLLIEEEEKKKIKDKIEFERERAQVSANIKDEEHRRKILDRMWEERNRLRIDEINDNVSKSFVIHSTASLDFDNQSLSFREDTTNLKIKISDLEINVEFLRENLRSFTELRTQAIEKLQGQLREKKEARETMVLEYQNANRATDSIPTNDEEKDLNERYQKTEKDILDISSKISSLNQEIQNEDSRVNQEIQKLELEIKSIETEMMELTTKNTDALEMFSTSQLSLEETEREQDLVRHKEIALAKEIGKDDPIITKALILQSEISHTTIEITKLNDEIAINNAGLDNRSTAIKEKELKLKELYQELETLKQDPEANKLRIKINEKTLEIRKAELSELKSERDRLLKDQVILKENLDSKMLDISRKKEIKDALEAGDLVASLEVERADLQQDSEKIAQQIAENTKKRQAVIQREKDITSKLLPKPQSGELPSYEYVKQQDELKLIRDEKRTLLMRGYALEELQLKNADSIKNIEQSIKEKPTSTSLNSTKKLDDKPTIEVPGADDKKKVLKKDAPPTLTIPASTFPEKKPNDNEESNKDDHSQKMSSRDQKFKTIFESDFDLKTNEDGFKRWLQGLFKLTILLQRAVTPVVRNVGGLLQASGGIVAMGLTAVPATVAKGITVVGEKFGADPNGKLIRGSNAVVNSFKSSASFSKEGLMKAGNLKRFGKDSFGLAVGRWVKVPVEDPKEQTVDTKKDVSKSDVNSVSVDESSTKTKPKDSELEQSAKEVKKEPSFSQDITDKKLPIYEADGKTITKVPPSPSQENGAFYPVDANMFLMTNLSSSESILESYRRNPYADEAASKEAIQIYPRNKNELDHYVQSLMEAEKIIGKPSAELKLLKERIARGDYKNLPLTERPSAFERYRKPLEICLMSDLKQGQPLESGKLYFEQKGSQLSYSIISSSGVKTVDKITLTGEIPTPLTKQFLDDRRSEILEIVSNKGQIQKPYYPSSQQLAELGEDWITIVGTQEQYNEQKALPPEQRDAKFMEVRNDDLSINPLKLKQKVERILELKQLEKSKLVSKAKENLQETDKNKPFKPR